MHLPKSQYWAKALTQAVDYQTLQDRGVEAKILGEVMRLAASKKGKMRLAEPLTTPLCPACFHGQTQKRKSRYELLLAQEFQHFDLWEGRYLFISSTNDSYSRLSTTLHCTQ